MCVCVCVWGGGGLRGGAQGGFLRSKHKRVKVSQACCRSALVLTDHVTVLNTPGPAARQSWKQSHLISDLIYNSFKTRPAEWTNRIFGDILRSFYSRKVVLVKNLNNHLQWAGKSIRDAYAKIIVNFSLDGNNPVESFEGFHAFGAILIFQI